MSGVIQSQVYSLLPACLFTNPFSQWFSKKSRVHELHRLIPTMASTSSAPLTERDVVKIDIVQLFTQLLEEHSNALKGPSQMATRQSYLSDTMANVVIIIAIPILLGSTAAKMTWLTNYSDDNWPALAFITTVISVSHFVEMRILLGLANYLRSKGQQQLQIVTCMEHMRKVDAQDFNRFMNEEMQNFPNIAKQMQEIIKTSPKAFLQILSQIYRLFEFWKQIKSYDQQEESYFVSADLLNSDEKSYFIHPQVESNIKRAIVDMIKVNATDIENVMEEIKAEKRNLENMLLKLSEEDSIV